MVRFTVERATDCTQAAAWSALLGFEERSVTMPGVESITVQGRNGDSWQSEWVMRMRGSRLRWRQEATADEAARTMRFRMLDGDPRLVAGEWQVGGEPGAATVRLEMEFEFGLPGISEILDPHLRRTIAGVVDHIAASPESRLADSLVVAIQRVVPPDVEVGPATPLEETTLDSLGLLEAMVHLEELSQMGFDEEAVRAVALEPDYDPAMSVANLAKLLVQHWRVRSDR